MNDWSREGERIRIETMVLTISVGAVLPFHEQLINVPEPPLTMYTPPPLCLYYRSKRTEEMESKRYRMNVKKHIARRRC